jgi:hypothetical protein
MLVVYSLDPVSVNSGWHFVVLLLHLDWRYTVVYLHMFPVSTASPLDRTILMLHSCVTYVFFSVENTDVTSLHYVNEAVEVAFEPYKTQAFTRLSERGVAAELVTLFCTLCITWNVIKH